MDNSKQDDFLSYIKAFLGNLYQLLKKLLSFVDDKLSSKETEYDINQPSDKKQNARGKWRWLAIALAVIMLLSIFNNAEQLSREEIPYNQFLKAVKENQVERVVVTEKYMIGNMKNGEEFTTFPLWNEELAELMESHDVEYLVRSSESWLGNILFNWVIPMVILVFIWSWFFRRTAAGGPGREFLNIGNKIRIHPETGSKITFDDVAGADDAKQELKETIDFLRTPEKIQKLGGRMPKGVLLVGSPGTGKTLLARAVSGEAGVPFFNISGSEFIELFVGVGAARVRELFEQARQKAPCIIFIDELDAIGRSRGGPVVMGGHDEREQTLNQLLTEMDGFDPSSGVVVMAATNRPEVLDKALLRAGRFDRQIVVDKPDMLDRVEILKLHCKHLTLAEDIDFAVIARRTPGLVGADLANIANEAAIIATRHEQDKVTMANFEAAIDRVLTGPEKKNRALSPDEKRRVAYHEAGHALVAEQVPTGQPVHKISIIPRGVSALGFTLQLPVEEKFLSTEDELKDQLAILLGGRMSEELVLGSISTGAQNDLEKASEIARNMVCYLGMSKKLGPLTYGKRQQLQFLPTEETEQRNYSEETARLVDSEIKALIDEAQKRARDILTRQRKILDQLADLLQEREVIGREELTELLKK
ncbi:ATP-dependent zinc metalloprotease FtsH [Methylomarinum vadi]|uniref:ATP-dependent zinc metalloprotease FtsH n=1 Tax=Methylomarinum vadi TaxID=438855 RepID=UPI0004DFA0C4|nr:ATP-dependent zinc metalloprotease FtsH [Methylomarinum vadi]